MRERVKGNEVPTKIGLSPPTRWLAHEVSYLLRQLPVKCGYGSAGVPERLGCPGISTQCPRFGGLGEL